MKQQIENILKILDNVKEIKVTVFGDFCLDKYIYTDPARDEISVETGLTAYQIDRQKLLAGCGGTIANNLCALGVNVRCVGLIGDDGEGSDLLRCLKKIGADTEFMVISEKVQTNVYMKPMRLNTDGTYTEMSRFDFRNYSETPMELQQKLVENLKKALADTQGVVICDQFLEESNAAVTKYLREALSELAALYNDKIFYADSRGFTGKYKNLIIKCNEFELAQAIADETDLQKQAEKLLSLNGKAVVVTVGENGAYVCEKDTWTHIPAFKVEGEIDITGAGDATSAGIIIGLASALSLPEAVLLGGCISSITIKQIGTTGTATVEQVYEKLLGKL